MIGVEIQTNKMNKTTYYSNYLDYGNNLPKRILQA